MEHGVACAQRVGLQGVPYGVAEKIVNRVVVGGGDDDDDPVVPGRFRRIHDVPHQFLPTDLVKDLGEPGPHADALAGGENDCGLS